MIDVYHRHNFCPGTQAAHENTKAAIAKDPERMMCWYRVRFPEGTILDNVIFSGDPTEVAKHSNGIGFDAGGVRRNTMFIYWRIALKNEGYCLDREVGTTIANAFA